MYVLGGQETLNSNGTFMHSVFHQVCCRHHYVRRAVSENRRTNTQLSASRVRSLVFPRRYMVATRLALCVRCNIHPTEGVYSCINQLRMKQKNYHRTLGTHLLQIWEFMVLISRTTFRCHGAIDRISVGITLGVVQAVFCDDSYSSSVTKQSKLVAYLVTGNLFELHRPTSKSRLFVLLFSDFISNDGPPV